MKVRSYVLYVISWFTIFLCGLQNQVVAKNKCSQAKVALQRGFQYPEYSNTYAAVQLFSMSDIGRTTYCIKKPISMVLSRPGDYEPECELNSSPMLKVKASGVSIDFNGFEIAKTSKNRMGDNLSYGVGIEVGFSPAELAADPTLEQVQNVVIKNGGLSNFEIGIVVHAGVKNVIIEDFYISRSPFGILLLGQQDNQVVSCMLKNVRVTGDLQDDALILQWAKVKVEENDVSSIDSSNGGSSLLKGKPGQPAVGFGYGRDYCFQQFVHNPVTNMNDAYSYYGIFMKQSVNVMLNNVLVKCIGYQQDAHEVVAPGTTAGSMTNSSNSAISINGDIIAGQVTPAVVKGIAIYDSSTVFLKSCEAVNCVSALLTYGLFTQDSSTVSVQNSAFSTNDAHHVTTGKIPQPTTDADIKFDTIIIDPKTGATIKSLYSTFCVDILALPTTTPPAIDPTIEPFRDLILAHKVAIDAGVSLSEMLYHVEQIVANAHAINNAYNDLVLGGATPTMDDADAHLQAAALLKSGTDLFQHLFRSIYKSGRICCGIFFGNSVAVELQDVVANYNKAQHYVSGVQAEHCDVFFLQSAACNHNVSDDMGDTDAEPVAHPAASHAHGVVFLHTDTITMQDVTANYNKSFGVCRGIYGFDIDSCKACTISCTNNEALHSSLQQGWVAGLCLFDAKSCTFATLNANANHAYCCCQGLHVACVSSSDFECVHADDNISDVDRVIGGHFYRCHALDLKDVSATSNSGELKAYGMLFDHCSGVSIDGAACDDNHVDRTNHASTDCYGMWWDSPDACFLKHISCSNNRGHTLGVGLYAQYTRTFHVEDADCCVNSSTYYVDGEADRCNDAPNASKFFSRDYPSGALGMYFVESCDVSLQRVTACKNFGLRAAGIFCLKSSDFVLCDCVTSFQSATGQYFINDPFKLGDCDPLNNILFCDFPIPSTQYSTIFGSPEFEDPLNPGQIIPADRINLLEAICCYLRSVALIPALPEDCKLFDVSSLAIKNEFICGKTGCLRDCSDPCDPCPGSFYCAQKKFSASWLLILAAMAKYRLFGTAVGLHMHDCDGFAVKNHFANGNTSLKDNAAGIACTGTNSNHIFDGTRAINNDAWTESELSAVIAGRYDLSAVKPFYDALYRTTMGTLTDDFDIGPGTLLMPRLDRFCTFIINKKMMNYFKIALDCSCPGGSGTPEDFWFTSPVGGIAAGVLLGDCAEHIEVRNIDCANNKGYSGFAFGLLQAVSANNNIDSNRFYQNFANLLGVCFGIADITTQSTSIIMRNFMFCNRIGDYLNFNYLVPYNPGDPFGLSFPIKTGFNGDFSTLILAGGYDNIEIRFTRPAPQNSCVPDYIGSRDPTMPDMLSCWEEAGFLETSGTEITTEFQQCIDNLSAIAPGSGALLPSFVNSVITAVLGSATGPVAVNAGRDAGVAAGLLEVVAFPASTVADNNRMMSLSELQALVCQEIFTQLNNDPVLLVIQEAYSVLIPRKRSHIPGLNHFEARAAGIAAGLNKGLLPVQAEGVATVVVAIFEHCLGFGGDISVYAGRDIFAMINAMMCTTRDLTPADILAAQQALINQAVAPDSDPEVQDSVERHVAIRLKRGSSETEAVATAVALRSYSTIISEFKAANPGFNAAAQLAAFSVFESFFDYEYEATLSGSPLKRVVEAAVRPAATASGQRVQDGGTDQEALLCGVYESILRNSVALKNPLKTQAEIDALVTQPLAVCKKIMLNCLKDLQNNLLLTMDRQEVGALVSGVTHFVLSVDKQLDENRAELDAKDAAKSYAQISGMNMHPCTVLAYTLQNQIDKGGYLLKLAGFGPYCQVTTATCLFDFIKYDPAGAEKATRALNVKLPTTHAVSYNSHLDYRDITFSASGVKVCVAGAVDGGAGTDPGLFIFNPEGLLVKKFDLGADVQSVAAHPVKDWLFVGLSDGMVKLIDMSAVESDQWAVVPTAVLPSHTDEVEVVRLSDHGLHLVSSGRDNVIKVFDITHPNPSLFFEVCSGEASFDMSAIGGGFVESVAFKGQEFVAVAHTGAPDVRILNLQTCNHTNIPVPGSHKAYSVDFSHDGTQLAILTDNSGVGTVDALLSIFDSSDPDPVNWLLLQQFEITGASLLRSAAYHPEQKYLAFADANNSMAPANVARVRLFDLTDADPMNWAECPSSPWIASTTTSGFKGVGWSDFGKSLGVTTAQSEVVLYDTSCPDKADWHEQKRFEQHVDKVNKVRCNPSGSLIATASADTTIKIWDGINCRQHLIASIDSVTQPVHAHTDNVKDIAWSTDGSYLFSISADGQLKVWDMTSGLPVFVQGLNFPVEICAIATVSSGGDDYIAVGRVDGQTDIVRFVRMPASLTVIHSIDIPPVICNIVMPGPAVTDLVFDGAGTRLVISHINGVVKCWDTSMTIPAALAAVLECQLDEPTFGVGNWHAGAVNAVDVTSDGNVIISGGDDNKIFITDVVTLATPVVRSTICDATGSITEVKLDRFGPFLASSSADGTLRVHDVSSFDAPISVLSLPFQLQSLCSVDWCQCDYDILVAGQYGFGRHHFVNRFCVAIAQEIANQLPDECRALIKARNIMRLIEISDEEAAIVAQAGIDYLLASPGDVWGAARVICDAFITPLTGQELIEAMVQVIKNCDHPVDEAVALTDLQGVDSDLARACAQKMYKYLKDNIGDVQGAAELCTLNNRFCRSVAQTLNDYGVPEATYLVQLVYPEGTYPGLAALIVGAGSTYLGANPADIDGTAQAVCDEIVAEGQIPYQTFCIAFVKQMQNYINFSRQIPELGCLLPVGLLPSGGAGFYREIDRLTFAMVDELRATPALPASQAAAETICLGSSLVPCAPAPTPATVEIALLAQMNLLDIANITPVQLTKQLRRTLETCSITGVTVANPSDPIETSAIAAAVVGRMQGQKVDTVALDMLDLQQAADMANTLLNGGLLPCGSLKNLRGDALVPPIGPAGQWGSSTSTLVGPFTTIESYLNALSADVLTGGTGLIDSTPEYAGLTVDEKAALARAIVLRTLLCGDELAVRNIFDGTTNATYPAEIATLVVEIVTTGLVPPIGLASLTLVARQEVAATLFLFYDPFTNFASSSELQAIIGGSFAAASAAGTLGQVALEPWFALFGGLGSAAGFMQDRALNPMSIDQQSVFDFIPVGSELARGLIGDHLMVTDLGSAGQHGVAKDLSQMVLSAVTAGMMSEGLSVIKDEQSVFYGAFGVPLAYNQIFGDQVCKSIARVVRENGNNISLGSVIGQFAGLSGVQATAVATAAVAPVDLQAARIAVCAEFGTQAGSLPTPVTLCKAMVQNLVDIIVNPGAVMLNPLNLSLFGTSGIGHPVDIAAQLAIAGGVPLAVAQQAATDVYTFLQVNPGDMMGAVDECQELLK